MILYIKGVFLNSLKCGLLGVRFIFRYINPSVTCWVGYLFTLDCGLLGVRIIFGLLSLIFPSALMGATGYFYIVRMLAGFHMLGPRLSLTC